VWLVGWLGGLTVEPWGTVSIALSSNASQLWSETFVVFLLLGYQLGWVAGWLVTSRILDFALFM
jgi:hypothetical protein